MTYMEEVEASTRKDYEGECQMMWEKQAIEFWMKIKGGQHTEEEGNIMWLLLEKECEVRDNLGPAKKPLRLSVKVKDTVKDVNSLAIKRRMLCEEKANKKAKQEDLDKLSKRITMNHALEQQALIWTWASWRSRW